MTHFAADQGYFVQTDAICTDSTIGDLLGQYLFDELDTSLKENFERHLDECTACFVAVTNWRNLGTSRGDSSQRRD